MQKVKLNLKQNQYKFYCPITGQKVLSPENFTLSPAMVFFYDELFDVMRYARPDIMVKYSNCEIVCDSMTVNKNPFEMLIDETLSRENNYVMFTLIYPEVEIEDIGIITQVSHIAFDMDYCENKM